VLKTVANEQNADFNKVDYFGRTALHVAAFTLNSLHIVQYLTEQAIHLDITDT
jgi:ankyrin repeat protein